MAPTPMPRRRSPGPLSTLALGAALALTLVASTAWAAEPTQATSIELDPGQGWTQQTAVAPASVRFRHDTTETTVELVALDAGPAPEDPSSAPPVIDATAALDDWLTQLADQDPRVAASARQRLVVDLGGGGDDGGELPVELVRIELDFEDRTAIVLGFTSRSVASARGEELDAGHDRYAWLVLLETDAQHRDALGELQTAVLSGLGVAAPR